ncbi:hypothetical protein [Nocardia vinacea]|uniref:hypothetical protein n=1 Tax=Nocardia vinacea TaxID=96468 RepID=UPI0002FF8545|nr:hypothetical protein [Nocardia vinacea]
MSPRRKALVVAVALAATLAIPACGGDSAKDENQSGTAAGPARNPYLAAATYGLTHIDPGQSDTFPYQTPQGEFHIDPKQQQRITSGPVNIMTLAATDPDHMWVSSTQGVVYVQVGNGMFHEIARADAPGVTPIPSQPLDHVLDQNFTDPGQVEAAVHNDWGVDWTRIANGVYSLADKDNRVYYVTQNAQIVVFGLTNANNPEAGVRVLRTLDFKPWLGSGPGLGGQPESIVGLNMTYDGKLAVLSTRGLSIIDRSLQGEPQQVHFGADEVVSNAMAVDDKGGIYAASDKIMRKVVWTGSKLSTAADDGAWASPYDFGQQPPAVKFGIGTGSTPTLMGYGKDDRLVVLTDGADRMKLVAFWRDAIPDGFQPRPGTKSNRIADQIQVTAGLTPQPEFIQSEQSVVVDGYGAFVVNNARPQGAPDRLVDVLAGGPVFAPPSGIERFQWDPVNHSWSSVWSRADVVSTSMVPTESSKSGVVFVNGYTKTNGWEVTGLDWKSGTTVHRTIFGQSNLGNGAYALVQFFPNGDLLFNSIGGPFRVKYDG